jgi:uncharacterized Zn finger protein
MKLWFGESKKERGEPRLTCHGCSSDRIEMVVPVSPEVLSYRCTNCGRQWSLRAPEDDGAGTA